MIVKGTEAWITSAVDNKSVSKAIVLAGSLRRVRTGKKLVVITTFGVTPCLRENLKDAFDLLLLIEEVPSMPNGVSLEECAKAEAFSLQIFNKCVYLSPNTLVLRNCDDIFEKYSNFAAFQEDDEKFGLNFSVYLFTPSLNLNRALEEIERYGEGMKRRPEGYFSLWILNNIQKIERLDEKYNTVLGVQGQGSRSLCTHASIVNFGEVHPLDASLAMSVGDTAPPSGKIEQVAAKLFQQIYLEDVKPKQNVGSDFPIIVPTTYKNEPIAIVGMSFRLPGGNNVDDFWDLLINGKNGIIPLPPSRWSNGHTILPCQHRNVDAGFLSIPVDEFDANFFGMGDKKAELLDPQIRLLHEVAWEALEDAYIDPHSLNGTQTGVFVGSWLQDYNDMLHRSSNTNFTETYLGTSRAAGAAQISQLLKSTGPSIGTESGCSSAIVAVDIACKSLQNHESDMALACGVNLLLHPFDYDTMSAVLSPDFRCNTFDESANGFARAEACAVLVLKRLSDAARNGDKIWGLIRGIAVTQEGISKSVGTPTIDCESLAMELALKDGNVDPLDVSYIETHGTGTPVGDPMEIAAITKAYSKGRTQPLVIGSVKTNVGHTESVSGITGIIKVLLSMKNEAIPRHLNLKKLNPAINLESIPATIPFQVIAWPKTLDKPRIAGVSSFGISGTDGHAIIQEPPVISLPQIHEDDERPLHVMKISAKSTESFHDLLTIYKNIISSKVGEDGFANLAYSANIGRATFHHRAVIIAKDFKEAEAAFRNKTFNWAEVQPIGSQLCFHFPGEGLQYPDMGATLYATSPTFRAQFNKCDQVLSQRFGINVRQILWGQSSNTTKLGVFCIEYCLLKLLESWGVRPDYVMGHGMGEYVAAVASGLLDFEDALTLATVRSQLIDCLPKGSHHSDINAVDTNIIKKFKQVAGKVRNQKIPEGRPKYISGMEGKLLAPESINPDYWVCHAWKSVNLSSLSSASKVAQSEGCSLILEVGPHPRLSCLNPEDPSISSSSVRDRKTVWGMLLNCLSQLYLSNWKGQVDWEGFDSLYKRSRVNLPFYPFNRRKIWHDLEVGLPTLHPLLGRTIPTASKIATIFENRMTLKNTTFATDHIIGNTVVFPASGFLEMCLAGGHATSNRTATLGVLVKPQEPVVLRSLQIDSPLALYDSGICRLQTTVKRDTNSRDEADELHYTVGVHRYVPSAHGGIGEWISHATAKFLPRTVTAAQVPLIDIQSIQDNWEKTDNIDFYDKLPEVGLRFGPKFRSLETGWKSEKGMLVTVKMPEEDHDNYLIHPIIGDAMIQATMLWTSKDKLKMKLQVPVQIGEFTWIQKSASPIRYIFCATNEEGKTNCSLLDDQGVSLAHMMDVDFIETSVKLVEGMIQQQGAAMPKLWAEVWKSVPGALQCSLSFGDDERVFLQLAKIEFDENNKMLAKINDVGDYEKKFYANICKLSRLFFLNALYDIGWKPEQGIPFTMEELLMMVPKPKEHYKRLFRYFLRLVADTGSLTLKIDTEDENKYYFEGLPPTRDDIDKGLRTVISADDASRVEYQMVCQVGKNLSRVLLEKIQALQLLFPDDPSMINAGDFYVSMSKWIIPILGPMHERVSKSIYFEAQRSYMNSPKAGCGPPILRLLEVGAGTGGFTGGILDYIDTLGWQYELYFTDISASFFTTAETKLEKYKKHIIFKKLNMEEDPLAQGFCPQYFDSIFACEVLHVAKDIRKTLKNLSCLMKPGGVFQIIETTQPDPRISLVFGLLDGYWQFEDVDFRPYHATLTPEMWGTALQAIDCEKVVCTPAYNNVHSFIAAAIPINSMANVTSLYGLRKPQYSWLILCHQGNAHAAKLLEEKLTGLNRKVYVIGRPKTCEEGAMKKFMKSEFVRAKQDVEKIEGVIYLWGLGNDFVDRDQAQVSLPLVTLLQEIAECLESPRVYVVTQGVANVEGYEVLYPTPGTLHGMIKSLSNENTSSNLIILDLSPAEDVVSQVDNIFYDLWGQDNTNRVIAFRDYNRVCMKLNAAKVSNNEPLPLPSGCDRFQLVLPKTRLISDLEFGVLENYTIEENEIEVKVLAMSVNFRDVLAVLKPIPLFEKCNSVGLDFAGVVTKVGSKVSKRRIGDRVIGMNMDNNLALPSHIKMNEEHVVPLQNRLTLVEGVTLPAVFSTAIHCLINVAKMKRGDTILIHTASGGVGLCAIQLAQEIGAEIFATAGSKRKQNYLRNLGIKHIFHSRTTDFGKQILEATNGRGVDIVLNSLTGEGFKEASLSALAKNGRFIEMSKLNVWSKEEVKLLRPDVFYTIEDLTALEKSQLLGLIEQLAKYIHATFIHPIAYERFDAVNIRGALTHMQKAKHIGKIVCVMPEVKVENSKFSASTPLFNEMSSYIVTGGLGGIGLEVVKWMLKKGAKHIAIISRSPPKPETASLIQSWNKSGKHVEAFPVDIGDRDKCRHLFDLLESLSSGFPQVRGVMHAAGVLSDATVENQTWSRYRHCYNPKVEGTWNLHDMTKDLLLEHFVLFSSGASSIGSPAQSNHAASNSFEDTLAAYRRSNGLPATTVNWGNWGEVGVATELDLPGIRPITTSQGFLALETFLITQTSHMSVLNIDQFSLAIKVFPSLKHMVDDKQLFSGLRAAAFINSDEFWAKVDATKDREEKLVIFKDFIKGVLRNILKIDQDEVIDDLADFQTLGIDSLMMLEMKNGMQNVLGTRVTLTAGQLKDCSNTEALASRFIDVLQGKEEDDQINFPTMEELHTLIREDSILPEHIRPNEIAIMHMRKVAEIETVLLTGSTGTLGPYLLRELSHRSSIKKIYCLIRKVGKKTPLERLLRRLETVNLELDVDMTKVECFQGDTTDDKFALSEEHYDELATNVDAVINCAVRSDHTSKYYKASESRKLDVRTVNVKGTRLILEFAVHKKLKHVYQGSTLLTVTTTDEHGCLSEEWQDVEAFEELQFNMGYPVSKHISEQLCKQAAARGIPVKTFRFPYIAGDSKTGRCDYLTNHAVLRWLAYLKLRCMPDMPSPLPVMPVDHCAQISIDIFFNSTTFTDVYNVASTDAGMDLNLIGIAEEFGIHVEPLSFSEFVGKLKLESDDSPLAPFRKMYEEEEEMVVQNFEGNPGIKCLQKYVENCSSFLGSRKLPQLIQNYGELESMEVVMRRDIRFLKESGVFDKFGIL